MDINGAFLVCGGEDEPSLHVLSPAAVAALYARQGLAWTPNGQRQALRLAFGVDALYALPAWRPECMADIAQHYDGTHKALVCGMAAALALGRSLARPDEAAPTAAPVAAKPATGPSGGQRARSTPRQPAPAGSGGGFFAGLGK